MKHFEHVDTAPLPVPTQRISPTTQNRAFLVVLRGQSIGRMHPILDRVVIGRGTDVDLRIDDQGISRNHVAVELAPDRSGFLVRDMGSRNGTKLNGKRVEAHRLQYGDRIEIGSSTCLKFIYQDELEVQLQDSQRLETIGRLAGGVAHEFNNVLTVILNNLSHIQATLKIRGGTDNEEFLECVTDSLTEVRRGAQLTRNLLGFARRGQFELKRVALHDFVDKFARLISRTVERNIRVHAEIDADLFVFGDVSQLHQVLLNLGLNARDAMPEGGELVIRARRRDLRSDDPEAITHAIPPGSYVVTEVSDTGIGMSEDIRQHIFEPFFSTKEGGKGTGLGLAVAYGIVRSHNGHLVVDSKVGKGSAFQMFLPALEPTEEVLVNPAEASVTNVVQRAEGTILVVDDEEGVRKSVERLLVAMGYEVLMAADGDAALATFKAHRDKISVVLLDLTMPKLDGEATFHRLRAIDPRATVVICSGHVDDERVTRLTSAGIAGLLNKPFERRALARTLNLACAAKAGSVSAT